MGQGVGGLPGVALRRYVYGKHYTYTMKTKLTITVDRDVLPRAKRHARARGVSLSSLIEGALREMVEPVGPSFTEKWRGSLQLAKRDDDRFKALEEKYG